MNQTNIVIFSTDVTLLCFNSSRNDVISISDSSHKEGFPLTTIRQEF